MQVTKMGFLFLISDFGLTGEGCADDDADCCCCCCCEGSWPDAEEPAAFVEVDERVDLGVMAFCGERRERPLSAETGGEGPLWEAGSAMMGCDVPVEGRCSAGRTEGSLGMG